MYYDVIINYIPFSTDNLICSIAFLRMLMVNGNMVFVTLVTHY